jgi:hypothetical protein
MSCKVKLVYIDPPFNTSVGQGWGKAGVGGLVRARLRCLLVDDRATTRSTITPRPNPGQKMTKRAQALEQPRAIAR